jgi:hypothetical protein
MGYFTVSTRSNRVVIISSVITRISFNSMQFLDGHISTYFNNDSRELLMLCIILMCQLYRVDLIIVVCLFYSLFDFCSFYCSIFVSFDSFAFIYSLFKEILNLDCIPGISILLYHCPRTPSSSMQVNKHHTSDCTDFVLV